MNRNKRDVWARIQREAAEADRANVDCFENRNGDPSRPESTDSDQSQLDGFESAVSEWIDRQHGNEKKVKALAFFVGMISRLRAKLGFIEPEQTRLNALDGIGMSIVSDFTVTVDGHSSIGVERVAPRVSRLLFEGQENIKIIGTEELKPSKCELKCNVNDGEIAAREFVFKDNVTGKTEVRRYALVDGDVRRIQRGKATPNWLNFPESYPLALIRAILSEVSK